MLAENVTIDYWTVKNKVGLETNVGMCKDRVDAVPAMGKMVEYHIRVIGSVCGEDLHKFWRRE